MNLREHTACKFHLDLKSLIIKVGCEIQKRY